MTGFNADALKMSLICPATLTIMSHDVTWLRSKGCTENVRTSHYIMQLGTFKLDLIWTFTLKIDVIVFLSDSSYHLQSEQTALNRQTGKDSLNLACICHLLILNNEVISEWKGNIEKNLSIEYVFYSGTRLMGIIRIHLKIYLPECTGRKRVTQKGLHALPL